MGFPRLIICFTLLIQGETSLRLVVIYPRWLVTPDLILSPFFWSFETNFLLGVSPFPVKLLTTGLRWRTLELCTLTLVG